MILYFPKTTFLTGVVGKGRVETVLDSFGPPHELLICLRTGKSRIYL